MDLEQMDSDFVHGFLDDQPSASTINGKLGDLFNCSGSQSTPLTLRPFPRLLYVKNSVDKYYSMKLISSYQLFIISLHVYYDMLPYFMAIYETSMKRVLRPALLYTPPPFIQVVNVWFKIYFIYVETRYLKMI